VETFEVIFDIPKRLSDTIFRNFKKYEGFWLLDTNFEFILKFSRKFNFNIKKGVNRIVMNDDYLRGSELIPNKIRVYGTELVLMISPNTSVILIYNIVAAWMGQEPNRIRISICRVGPRPVESMGHVLTSVDSVWNGIYNFEKFEAKISRKENDMPNLNLNINENVDVVIDLKSVILRYKMNRFLKLVIVKRILKNRLLKDYYKCPKFEDESAIPYPEDMKIEMFCGQPIQGYLSDQRSLSIKVRYIDGSFNVTVNNYKTIQGIKKKMFRLFGLGSDVVITDEENRSYNHNMIFEYLPEEIWLCIQNSGSLFKAELKRFESDILKGESYHNFNAMIFSAWNHAALIRYINYLIGGENRLMELYVDGNIWDTEDVAINITRAKIKVLLRKKNPNPKKN
jgi:hypothetical protein